MSLQINNMHIILEIENAVKEKGISYIDAILDYCEKNNLEIEFGSDLVKKDAQLKAKVELEAEKLLLIKNTKGQKQKNQLMIDDE